MYGLTPEDLASRRRARAFTDELIRFELEAEATTARSPTRSTKAHHERAIELGLHATNMPTSVGGRGCTALQQVLVQEQAGRVTNGIGVVLRDPAVLVARGRQRPPARDLAAADRARREGGVLRDHRGGRRLRRRRPHRHRATRRRRLRPRRGEVARHVVQRGRLRVLPGRADRPVRTRRPGAVRRRHGHPRGARRPHPDVHAHPRARSTRSSRSRGCGCRPGTWSAARATACPSSTSGSASSG